MRRTATPSFNKGPLPVKQTAKLIYQDRFTLNPGVGGLAANYVFSANGLFDPNITGVGHQPRGWDQLVALYDHAIVTSAKITIWAANSQSDAQQIIVRVKDGTTVTTSDDDIFEDRFIKTNSVSSLGMGPKDDYIVMTVDPIKFLGRAFGDSELKNSVVSNPTESCYFHVSALPYAAVDSGAIYCRARIEYTCTFIEPKQPNIS